MSQVRARSSGKSERMVVVFNDQLTNLPANRAQRHAREVTAASMQAPLVAQLKQVRATHLTTLSLLNAVAATMPAAEAQALSHIPGIKAVVPDGTIIIGDGTSTTKTVAASRVGKPIMPATAADGQQLCNTSPRKPLLEPEALTSIHDASNNPNDPNEASAIATGQGVIVGTVDANSLAGNANMIRPNGQHVVIDAPDPNENVFSDEFNGDVSTIAAQGTVTYTYASQLPFSNFPTNCSFRIVGDATGASLLSTGFFSDTNSLGQIVAPESQVIAGLQQAVNEGVNVVSESYGFGALPGANDDLLEPTNDAMVQAGVVVVESASDSGSSGTVEAPADDPNIIDAAGTNDLRLLAQADGYTKGWEDDNMTTLSSGGTAPNGA
ncbi:MAG: peptidase, partial [Solirubrobacteraceae bacterium]